MRLLFPTGGYVSYVYSNDSSPFFTLHRSLYFPLREHEFTLLAHYLNRGAQGYHCFASLSFTSAALNKAFKSRQTTVRIQGLRHTHLVKYLTMQLFVASRTTTSGDMSALCGTLKRNNNMTEDALAKVGIGK